VRQALAAYVADLHFIVEAHFVNFPHAQVIVNERDKAAAELIKLLKKEQDDEAWQKDLEPKK
jgi:hypothetical protein